jgi:hypothetical protein
LGFPAAREPMRQVAGPDDGHRASVKELTRDWRRSDLFMVGHGSPARSAGARAGRVRQQLRRAVPRPVGPHPLRAAALAWMRACLQASRERLLRTNTKCATPASSDACFARRSRRPREADPRARRSSLGRARVAMRFTRSFSHASDNERGPSPSATISKPFAIVRRLERSNPFPSWIKQADCIRTVSLPCHKHRVGGPGEPPVARNPIVGSLGARRLGGGAATLSAVHDRLAAVVACNAHLGMEVVEVGPGRGVRVPEGAT